MVKFKILKEVGEQQVTQPAANTNAEPANAAPVKQQTPEEMAQAAYPILQDMVNKQLIPVIQKTIAAELAKDLKGQQPDTNTQAPAEQITPPAAAEKTAAPVAGTPRATTGKQTGQKTGK